MISQLYLERFTAFDELTIQFSPKINIIIGENGTGKTQLLKAAYALSLTAATHDAVPKSPHEDVLSWLSKKITRLFMHMDNHLGNLRRAGSKVAGHFSANHFGSRHLSRGSQAVLGAEFAPSGGLEVRFSGKSDAISQSIFTVQKKFAAYPVFIPTKEVLSLAKGISAVNFDQATIEAIFDDGYLDLVQMLLCDEISNAEELINTDPRLASIVPSLTNLIGGRYTLGDQGFEFESGRYEEIKGRSSASTKAGQVSAKDSWKFKPEKIPNFSSGLTAEGFRKIGVLQRLLANGKLRPGVSGPLFWDEPESNLNPKLMKQLVEVLLELSRNGQQIILATHDYVLLKWFDLLMDKGKGDQVRFHVLSRDFESGQIRRDSMDDYRAIEPNAIADTFNELTKEQVARKMGSLGK
jgi:energy-coupling factor transporter ATP-binding protein EcfA2